jgi:hypothetical protein
MPAEGRETAKPSTEVDLRRRRAEWEWELTRLAARQHGVVTLKQLVWHGLSASAVRDRVAGSRLHRVHQGVYALGRPDLPAEGRWMAAVLACGRGALLSHRSAAGLHDLLSTSQAAIDIAIPRRSVLSRPGIRLHRSPYLTPVDRFIVRNIPCTSVARTLLDLASVVPVGVLDRACNQAEVLRLLDMAAMAELLERSRGRRGVRSLRAVLGTELGTGIPRSVLERRFLALCRRVGLPSPSVNEWIAIEGEEMQFDFVWHAQRVVVEVDGWDTHRTKRAFREDRRRDRLLRLAGWEPARFTWDDVSGDPARVELELRTLASAR